jgi:hypothetical protein
MCVQAMEYSRHELKFTQVQLAAMKTEYADAPAEPEAAEPEAAEPEAAEPEEAEPEEDAEEKKAYKVYVAGYIFFINIILLIPVRSRPYYL